MQNVLAKLVIERVPSVEMVRFVSSGTEACLSVLRLMRAYTKREKIIKFVGCYHGHADSFLVKAGSGVATLGLPDSPGKHARLFKRVFRERRGWGLQEGDRLARHFKGFWERRGWALQEGDRLARHFKRVFRERRGWGLQEGDRLWSRGCWAVNGCQIPQFQYAQRYMFTRSIVYGVLPWSC